MLRDFVKNLRASIRIYRVKDVLGEGNYSLKDGEKNGQIVTVTFSE